MKPKKAPTKLQTNCLYQFDKAVELLGLSFNVGLVLTPFVSSDHIATSIILDKLNTTEGIHCFWGETPEIMNDTSSHRKWILVSNEGDTYLAIKHQNNTLQLSAYSQPDEDIEVYEGTVDELIKDFKLIPFALMIEKVSSSKLSNMHTKPLTSYMLSHFFNQKATSKIIVGVSIAIALLGVATPLGFQTVVVK